MKRLLMCVAMLLLVAESTQATLFLKIGSIPGSSNVVGRKDWIEISSFGIGVRAIDEAGQLIPPRPTPLRIASPASTSSPHIFAGIVNATKFNEVRIDITQSAASSPVLAYWKLTEARIISYETTVDGPSTIHEQYDVAPMESVTYGFNDIDPSGVIVGNVEFTWNLTTGAASTVTTGMVTGFQFLSGDVDISDLSPVITPPALLGDFNLDGSVDAADYVVWRKNLGSIYTPKNYNGWRAHFGEAAGAGLDSAGSARLSSPQSAGAPTAPEPASLALLLLSAICLLFIPRDSAVAHSVHTPRR